jgi:hypothetical protein
MRCFTQARAVHTTHARGREGALPIDARLVILCALVCAGIAHADCADPLPATLPLNGVVTASTCATDGNERCDWTAYPSPITTSRFTLAEAGTVNFALSGLGSFSPALYLSGGVCDEEECGPELPAGSYCATVTADPGSAIGSCGCFNLAVATMTDPLFDDGFD